MIKIAVLDDDRTALANVAALLEQFAGQSPHPFEVKYFCDPFDMLQHAAQNGGFDLYLLDMLMPAMTGIEVAERIRRRGERCELIFLTSSREYGVDAFEVEAAGYLVKPLGAEQFAKVTARAIEKLTAAGETPLLIKVDGELRKIFPADIVMVESFNHVRKLTLKDGSAAGTALTLAALREMLKEHERFFCPHRAYIINLDYVSGVQSGQINMFGGYCVPLPKALYRKFKDYYFDYCFKK